MILRVEYYVGPELKFLSNLDMMRLMERALRRAQIPYALSEGFNPHLLLSMGTVLPVGLWGQREYFDLKLKEDMDSRDFITSINSVLPSAMAVNDARPIDLKTPALMKTINCASYVYHIKHSAAGLDKLSEHLMNQTSLMAASRGKKKDTIKDLRPGIYKIFVKPARDFAIMEIWAAAGDPVNIRYDELAEMLAQNGIEKRDIIDMYRSGSYIRQDELFYSPLDKVR